MKARNREVASHAPQGLRLSVALGMALGLLLSGCDSVPRVGESFVAGLTQGSGAVQMEAPAAGRGDTSRLDPAGSTAATSLGASHSGDAAKTVIVGGQKSKELATFEGDLGCTRMVAPYQMADNLDELAKLAGEMLGLLGKTTTQGLMSQLGGGTQGGTGKVLAQGQRAVKHAIPTELRARAVRLNWLPMSAERRFGEMSLDKMKGDLVPREGPLGRRLYPEADALLQRVLRGVQEPHDYSFSIHLSSDSGGNATALPGGIIVLDLPLIQNPQLRAKAEYAVAHEVAHVLQRHETRALQARIIDALVVSKQVADLYGKVRSLRSNPAPVLELLLQGKLQFQRHYGDQELHADGCAIRLVDRAAAEPRQRDVVVNAFVADLRSRVSTLSAAVVPIAANNQQRVTLSSPASPPWSNLGSAALSAAGVTSGNAGLGAFDDLVTLVSSPIDRHPEPQRRIKNIGDRMAQLRPASTTTPPLPRAASQVPRVAVPVQTPRPTVTAPAVNR